MKIVINRCYGGFSLSYEGVMYYAKLKGIKLYAYVEKREDGLYTHKPYKPAKRTIVPFEKRKDEGEPVIIHYATKKVRDIKELNKYYWSMFDIKRDDPTLVKTVEDLGERASGIFSELKVVEVPDGIDWEITEYGGMEEVEW